MTLERTLSRLWLALLLIGGVVTGMAATITPGSPDVSFSVYDGNDYLTSTPIQPSATSPGLFASSDIAGSAFELTAQGTGTNYSDAGIVLYFQGGFQLGSLRSVSVESTGTPVSINLWFDTGHDGKFFSVDPSGILSVNDDSYGGFGGNALTADSSFYMFGGDGAGHTFTLAELQSGADPGIDGNTRAALWIGITNPPSVGTNRADISSVTVTTPEPVSMIFVGSGLVGLAIAGRRRKK